MGWFRCGRWLRGCTSVPARLRVPLRVHPEGWYILRFAQDSVTPTATPRTTTPTISGSSPASGRTCSLSTTLSARRGGSGICSPGGSCFSTGGSMFLPTDRAWRDARLAAQCWTSSGKQLSINLTRCGACRRDKTEGLRLLRVHSEPRRVLLYFMCARCAGAEGGR